NDTPATANPTVGVNTLVVLGELSPIGDQDYFTFVVTDLGQPVPNHPAVVRIDAGFTTEIFSKPYSFTLTSPRSEVIFSGLFSEPRAFLFNPTAIGGAGLYVIRFASESATSVGLYRISIVGDCEGLMCRPPTVAGGPTTAITPPPVPLPMQIPTLSQ